MEDKITNAVLSKESRTGICARLTVVLDKIKALWKCTAIAIIVFVGLDSFAQKAAAQDPVCEPTQSTATNLQGGRVVLGHTKMLPNYISSEPLKPIRNFLIKNCKFDRNAEGAYYVFFSLQKDGSIKKESIHVVPPPFDMKGPDLSDVIIKKFKKAPKIINPEYNDKNSDNKGLLVLPFLKGRIVYKS